MNTKYYDARNDYNRLKNELGESKARITQLDNKLKALLIECVSLKVYINEVARIVPVRLLDHTNEDQRRHRRNQKHKEQNPQIIRLYLSVMKIIIFMYDLWFLLSHYTKTPTFFALSSVSAVSTPCLFTPILFNLLAFVRN